jgi:hypothetical protein
VAQDLTHRQLFGGLVRIVPGRTVDRRALAGVIVAAYHDIVARMEAEA